MEDQSWANDASDMTLTVLGCGPCQTPPKPIVKVVVKLGI